MADLYKKLIIILLYKYYNIMNTDITFTKKTFHLEPLKKKHSKKIDIIDIKDSHNETQFPKKPFRLAPLYI